MAADATPDLVDDVLAGEHRALARVITMIENREAGYRDVAAALHRHATGTPVLGVTGSPGSGKSTLVDRLAEQYRDAGLTVGVIAVDPSSPFSGGAVLGDRIRMGSTVGDMDVFFRSMSARGTLGGLSNATADAVKALDAFGKDRIIVETVGAGQNEVDIVRRADTVAVLVPPGSGDDVQMLKAGILEIGDVFVVNKADLDGATQTVRDLEEMIQERHGTGDHALDHGHHGSDAAPADGPDGEGDPDAADDADGETWVPPVIETVAVDGEGVDAFRETVADHVDYLDRTGERERIARVRAAAEIRNLLRSDVNKIVEAEIDRHGGMDALIEEVLDRETDPYTLADELLDRFDVSRTGRDPIDGSHDD